MINAGVSATTQEPDQTASDTPKQRIPLMAIPITLAVGLLVAAGYVGNRILASRAQAAQVVVLKPAAAHPVASVAAPAPAAVTTPSPVPKPSPFVAKPVTTGGASLTAISAAAPSPSVIQAKNEASPASPEVVPQGSAADAAGSDSDLGLIAPQHGERYLQIAAIGSHMVPKFLSDLARYKVQASVAPGPHEGLVRVVIGPFADRESAARAKEQIQTQWPDCFVRLY